MFQRFTMACGLCALALVSAGAAGCPSDEDDGPSGEVDTSNTGYCQDYVDMCQDDALRNVKLEVCLEECTEGVKVAAYSVRDSVCWKTACSLELGLCETYDDDAPDPSPYEQAIYDCAMRHGWYEDF